jgi:hypothetical protein
VAANRSERELWRAVRSEPERPGGEAAERSNLLGYFKQVEKVLLDVCYTRSLWRTELDAALKLLGQGKVVAGLAQASRLGHSYESSFTDHGRALGEIAPPRSAERYHALLVDLLDQLANANARLARAATHRDTKMLSDCLSVLKLTRQRFEDLSREKEALTQRWNLEDLFGH